MRSWQSPTRRTSRVSGSSFPSRSLPIQWSSRRRLPQHAEEDRLQQPAVRGGKHAAVGVALDQGLGVVMALGPGAEGGDGGLADVEVFGGHGK